MTRLDLILTEAAERCEEVYARFCPKCERHYVDLLRHNEERHRIFADAEPSSPAMTSNSTATGTSSS